MRIASIFAGMLFVALGAVGASLDGVKSVYILPMTGGLDQHIASRLARTTRFEVVTKPEQADAVLSDQVGEVLERRMAELYPPPKPEPKPAPAEPADDTKAEGQPAPEPDPIPEAFLQDSRPRQSSFSRGKGNVFLIDRKTQVVLWSDFKPPRSSNPTDLQDAAAGIVNRLVRSATPKQ